MMRVSDTSYRLFLSFFLFFIHTSLYSQKAQPIVFKHLSLSEGLSQSPVFSILQDRNGHVWIGSRDGLIRYDGYEFKLYKNYSFDKRTISHRDINAMYEDKRGNLWLATSSGVFVYQKNKEKFRHIPVAGVGFVFSLLPAKDNTMLLGTNRGIRQLKYTPDGQEKEVPTRYKLPENSSVYKLFNDRQNRLWAGTDSGVYCFDTGGKFISHPVTDKRNRLLSKAKVSVINQDRSGNIFIGTEDAGLFCYDIRTQKTTNYLRIIGQPNSLPSDYIKDIYINNDGKVWIATRNGLSIFDRLRNTFTNFKHQSDVKGSLSHNTIWAIMKDRAGSIWLATYAGGISIYNPSNANFTNLGEGIGFSQGLNQPVINAITTDRYENLWVGTDGGGLNYIDKTGRVTYYNIQDFAQKKNSNIVKALTFDRDGALWLGTLDGLAKFSPSSGRVNYIHFDHTPARNTRINALLATGQGIWAASDVDGLKFIGFDGRQKQYHQGAGSIASDHTNALFRDIKNRIWIGTNSGLSCYDPQSGSFDNYQNNTSIKGFNSNIILSIYQDAHARIWAGSRSGLQILDEKSGKFYSITETDGLPNSVVQAITEDNQNNLWVSTNNGISKISFTRHTLPLGKADYKITNYTHEDGLASNQFMSNAVHKSSSGRLFFGGTNGITSFFPKDIIRNNYPPRVVITDFMIHNEPVTIYSEDSPLKVPIEETTSVILKYSQAFITFRFAALNFINPDKNIYAYKLEGLNYNDSWHFSGKQRVASYTSLEPGKYIFKVKAANNDGVWNEQSTDIGIEVLPPLWRTWWAYCLYVILFSIVLIVVIRFFRKQARLERDLYYEHLQFGRQQELHQMKLNFFTNISHEIRTPLTLISGPVEKLLAETHHDQAINKQLQGIRRNVYRLLNLVTELMDFRKAESGNMVLKVQKQNLASFLNQVFDSFAGLADTKNITYEFIKDDPDDAFTEIYFDRIQMEKVLFNLLSNAFKFTGEGGSITLRLNALADKVEIQVIDNGIGIPGQHQEKLFTNFYQVDDNHERNTGGSGIGLAFSKSIVDLHHGKISFESTTESESSAGRTVFKIVLPKGYLHFRQEQIIPSEIPAAENMLLMNNEPGVISAGINLIDQELTDSRLPVVLVVDDNEEVREFIAQSLKAQYNIIESENGLQGFETAIIEIPDLIISDVMMPVMDGVEFCRKIKSDERTSHIPVVLLTARSAHVHQVSGLSTGADSYITKPFSVELLLLNVRNLLTSRALMKKKFSRQMLLQPKEVIITDTEEKFLRKLMDIIEEHIDDPEFGVSGLASEIGMSQPVLYRKIKGLTDLTVADFIKSLRLKKAAMLLAQDKLSIADVAFAVGFNNRKHFSQEFKKYFGKTPSEYTQAEV